MLYNFITRQNDYPPNIFIHDDIISDELECQHGPHLFTSHAIHTSQGTHVCPLYCSCWQVDTTIDREVSSSEAPDEGDQVLITMQQ